MTTATPTQSSTSRTATHLDATQAPNRTSVNPDQYNPTTPPAPQATSRSPMRQSLDFIGGIALGSLAVATALPKFRAVFQEDLPKFFSDTLGGFFENIGENITEASQAIIESSTANNVLLGVSAVIGAPIVLSKYLHKQLRNWTDINRNKAIVSDLNNAIDTDGTISQRTANRLIKASHQLKTNNDYKDYTIIIKKEDTSQFLFNDTSTDTELDDKTRIIISLTDTDHIETIELTTRVSDTDYTIPCYKAAQNYSDELVIEESAIQLPERLKASLTNALDNNDNITELAKQVVQAIRPATHQIKGHLLLGPRVTDRQSLDLRAPASGKLLQACHLVADTLLAPLTLPLLLANTLRKSIHHKRQISPQNLQLNDQQLSDALRLMQEFSAQRKSKGHTNIIEATAVGASTALGISAITGGLGAPAAIGIGVGTGAAAYGSGRFLVPSRFQHHEQQLHTMTAHFLLKEGLSEATVDAFLEEVRGYLSENKFEKLHNTLHGFLAEILADVESIESNEAISVEIRNDKIGQYNRLLTLAKQILEPDNLYALDNLNNFFNLAFATKASITALEQQSIATDKNNENNGIDVDSNNHQAPIQRQLNATDQQGWAHRKVVHAEGEEKTKIAPPTPEEDARPYNPFVVNEATLLMNPYHPTLINTVSIVKNGDDAQTPQPQTKRAEAKPTIAKLLKYSDFEQLINIKNSKKWVIVDQLIAKLNLLQKRIAEDTAVNQELKQAYTDQINILTNGLKVYANAKDSLPEEKQTQLLNDYKKYYKVLHKQLVSYNIHIEK